MAKVAIKSEEFTSLGENFLLCNDMNLFFPPTILSTQRNHPPFHVLCNSSFIYYITTLLMGSLSFRPTHRN